MSSSACDWLSVTRNKRWSSRVRSATWQALSRMKSVIDLCAISAARRSIASCCGVARKPRRAERVVVLMRNSPPSDVRHVSTIDVQLYFDAGSLLFHVLPSLYAEAAQASERRSSRGWKQHDYARQLVRNCFAMEAADCNARERANARAGADAIGPCSEPGEEIPWCSGRHTGRSRRTGFIHRVGSVPNACHQVRQDAKPQRCRNHDAVCISRRSVPCRRQERRPHCVVAKAGAYTMQPALQGGGLPGQGFERTDGR